MSGCGSTERGVPVLGRVRVSDRIRGHPSSRRSGKPFDLLPQVGQTHMFYEPELQTRYWQRIFAFFKAYL